MGHSWHVTRRKPRRATSISMTDGSTDRVAAWVEEYRAAGSHAADPQELHHRLLQELLGLQERWAAVLSDNSLNHVFQLLLQVALTYSGGHAGGATAGSSSTMGIPLISSAVVTSESVLLLLCELLATSYDYTSAGVINDQLASKHASLYVKTAMVMVVARLPGNDANQFVQEAIGLAARSVKAADFYAKQCLLDSVARILRRSTSSRLHAQLGEALKMASRCVQDKSAEVRVAAAGLLHVVATKTMTISHTSASHAHTSTSSGSTGVSTGVPVTTGGQGAPNSSSGAPSSSGTASSSTSGGATLEGVMSTAVKGLDDASPEVKRAFAVVVGIVLAKYAAFGAYDLHNDHAGDDTGSPNGMETDNNNSSGSSSGYKSKSLGFKLPGVHVPGITRRKTGANAADFSSLASVINYFKDLLASKFLSAAPSHGLHHGGMLAAFALSLSSMFEHLPAELVGENSLDEIVTAVLSLLDLPLPLPDLTRARSAVGFALRMGVARALPERQQTALLAVYASQCTSVVEREGANHHKALVLLVETSHLVQTLGEGAIVHADDLLPVLNALLTHEKQSLRFQAAVAMASLLSAVPAKVPACVLDCLANLRETTAVLLKDSFDVADSGDDDDALHEHSKSKTQLYAVQGYSTALAHIVRAVVLSDDQQGVGLSHVLLSSILSLAERLLESQFIDGCSDSIWLTCTRAGWTLVGSVVAVKDTHWIHQSLKKLEELWLRASVLHMREASLELLRLEAATAALHSFLLAQQALVSQSETLQMLAAHVLHTFLMASQTRLAKPHKRRGQLARTRLLSWILKSFSLLPPEVYKDSFLPLLELVTECSMAQALTSVTKSVHPIAKTSLLAMTHNAADDVLVMASPARLQAGDMTDALFTKELNLLLALLSPEPALSDVEIEVQYMDTFWRLYTPEVSHQPSSCFTSVRVVDVSVTLLGTLFHALPDDLQLRCLQHCATILVSPADTVTRSNIAAILQAIARQTKTQAQVPAAAWPTSMQHLLIELSSTSTSDAISRAAGEALGLLAATLSPVEARANLVTELETRLIKAEPNTHAAGALVFALASVKRACGSGVSVDASLLLRFASDSLAPPSRVWALHAWSVVLDASAVDSSTNSSSSASQDNVSVSVGLVVKHVAAGFCTAHKSYKKSRSGGAGSRVALARVLNGVAASLGPELATADALRCQLETLWALLRADGCLDSRVELEFLKWIAQLVVFVPNHVTKQDVNHIFQIVAGQQQHVDQGGEDDADDVEGPRAPALQRLALACVRTLAERDTKSMIHDAALPSVLFAALQREAAVVSWRFLPPHHGLAAGHIEVPTEDAARELEHTLLALIDVDGGHWGDCQPCVWALLCRGVAIGESSSTSSSTSDQEDAMSPRAAEAEHGDDGSASLSAWRSTKHRVGLMLQTLPLLSRSVRSFALTCVLRVLELVSRGQPSDILPHFDVTEADSRLKADPTDSRLNFLSMYVDELVTLACHAALASSDGHELQRFQALGLQLLTDVLSKFGDAKDPEVEGTYLLDPYQAQIASALRHAVKQASQGEENTDEPSEVLAPLAVHAFTLAGDSVHWRLVQDKVAFGRLLRMVVRKDYGFGQSQWAEATRATVALANLACLANLVVSSLQDPLLAKALTGNLTPQAIDLFIKGWLDATACYGLLMHGVGHWPVAALLPVRHDHTLLISPLLKLSIPVQSPTNVNTSVGANAAALREAFKKFWPSFPLAIASLIEANAADSVSASHQEQLLTYSVFHLVASVRERHESSSSASLLLAIPKLLASVLGSPSASEVVRTTIAALAFASSHAYASERLACLHALFACLQIKPLPDQARHAAAHAALCPLQHLAQLADPAKHRLSITGRDDASAAPQLLRFAANGIVFLRSVSSSELFDALPLVDQCAVLFLRQPQASAYASTHRAVFEAAVGLLSKSDDDEETSEYYAERIGQSLASLLELLDHEIAIEDAQDEEDGNAVQWLFKLIGNTAVASPPRVLSRSLTAFHHVVSTRTVRWLKDALARCHPSRAAALLSGVHSVVQRLIEAQDTTRAQLYLGMLGPLAISYLDAHCQRPQAKTIHELDAVEAWLRLTSTQLSDAHGAAFVRLLLPKLATLLLRIQQEDASLHADVSPVAARLLIGFAQTRGAAFKEVVATLAASERSVLEASLRSALMAPQAAAKTPVATTTVTSTLDLSRYK